MRAGVGYSEVPVSHEAGAAAAREALLKLGGVAPDIILLCATVQHDMVGLRDGVRSVVGMEPRLVGWGAVGAATNKHAGYGGNQVGLAAIKTGGARCDVFYDGDLDDGETDVGHRLGAKIRDWAGEGNNDFSSVLIYDSISTKSGRPRLNMCTSLLEGFREGFGGFPSLVGAGAIGDVNGTGQGQLIGEQVFRQQAIALTFSGDVRMDSVIMHGCQPVSDYLTVTKAEGQFLYELDGKPAIEVIGGLLKGAVPPEKFGFFVTLGMNKGDKWSDYDEGAYVNRLCLKADLKRNALMMFEQDLTEGTEVQLMHRNIKFDYIERRINDLFDRTSGYRPALGLYINCAGRAAGYCGMDAEDMERVQRVTGDRVPLLGFYSGVEVGEILGQPTPLDWTGVYCLLSVPE